MEEFVINLILKIWNYDKVFKNKWKYFMIKVIMLCLNEIYLFCLLGFSVGLKVLLSIRIRELSF